MKSTKASLDPTSNLSLPSTNLVLSMLIEHSFTASFYLLLTSLSRASYARTLVYGAYIAEDPFPIKANPP
jgi:hypothetical protein